MELPVSGSEQALLAAILMKADEELSAEKIEGATRALVRVQIRRRLEQIQRQLESLRTADASQLRALMDEKLRLKRALMNPGLKLMPTTPPFFANARSMSSVMLRGVLVRALHDECDAITGLVVSWIAS